MHIQFQLVAPPIPSISAQLLATYKSSLVVWLLHWSNARWQDQIGKERKPTSSWISFLPSLTHEEIQRLIRACVGSAHWVIAGHESSETEKLTFSGEAWGRVQSHNSQGCPGPRLHSSIRTTDHDHDYDRWQDHPLKTRWPFPVSASSFANPRRSMTWSEPEQQGQKTRSRVETTRVACRQAVGVHSQGMEAGPASACWAVFLGLKTPTFPSKEHNWSDACESAFGKGHHTNLRFMVTSKYFMVRHIFPCLWIEGLPGGSRLAKKVGRYPLCRTWNTPKPVGPIE